MPTADAAAPTEGTTAAADERRRSARGRRRGGRPSRAAAEQLGDLILESATELFLSQGYGNTSIDAVAAHAGISKRTFYHRFDDKAALFTAVVARIIEQIRPPPDVPLVQGSTLEEILERLAGFMLRAALAPRSLALHRLVTAESARFPHLARAVYDAGWAQATALIGDVLARELRELAPQERSFAAQQFIHMVVVVPQRRALGLGPALAPRELQEWAAGVVRLFLGGVRRLRVGAALP